MTHHHADDEHIHEHTDEHGHGGHTQPGGGRQDNVPGDDDVLVDPSHPANPLDGAPSPGPQPGSTIPDDDTGLAGRADAF